MHDSDAFAAGADAAVAALAPHARADGPTGRARLSRAVLREALTSYARTGASDLREFIALLGALPEGVSQLDEGVKIGAKMAQLLTAAMVNDPLFGGNGTVVDPGELLTPPPGFRARISVVSFVGLPDDQQRQTFVNQLQLALFEWIKRNPTGDFFGLLTSRTQIDAAQEMARAKGSLLSDVGRLATGQFYAAVAGGEFVKMQAPICLSHHPKSPLSNEQVIDRANRGVADPARAVSVPVCRSCRRMAEIRCGGAPTSVMTRRRQYASESSRSK
ncbi:hypothetical protein ACLQ3B_01015 [Micromonospora sp. DT53]|uniref:hypothetical protein n=1 Tax=Micromonospora sp. DT53 TaxID=3393444 RepID=UPI003CFAE913